MRFPLASFLFLCSSALSAQSALPEEAPPLVRLDVPMREQGTTSRGISIGDDVLIGAGSCILNGAEIGSGVIIAAGSVVSGTIPPRAVIQGDPAQVVFMRR